MYQNSYGERISSKVFDNEKKYIHHLNSEMIDSFEGSGMQTNASKCPCGRMPCQCMRMSEESDSEGCGMSGGSGYAQATFRDLGYDPTLGATGSGKGSKTYRKKGCGQIAALPPPENVFELGNVGAGMPEMPEIEKVMPDKKTPIDPRMVKRVVGGGTKEIKEDLGKFDFNRLKDYVGLAKPKELTEFKKYTGLRGKGFDELKSDLRKFDANRIKDYVGLGRYGKKYMKGSGFFDNIANFFKQFPEKINSVIAPIANKINETVQKGRQAVGLGKKSGKGTKEIKEDLAKLDFNRLKDYVGLGKGRNIPQKVVERSVMQPVIGAGSSGGGDGRKTRAEIVKKIIKQRGVSMIEASKIVKAENLYKK